MEKELREAIVKVIGLTSHTCEAKGKFWDGQVEGHDTLLGHIDAVSQDAYEILKPFLKEKVAEE